MEDLFPALPEDISAASPEELKSLIEEHEAAKDLIKEENAEFLGDRSADEILAQLERGGNQYQLLLEEQKLRDRAHENYMAKKDENLLAFEVKDADEEEEESEEAPALEDEEEKVVEVPAAEDKEEEKEEQKSEERELVLASADPEPDVKTTASNGQATVRFSRTPPAPKPDRVPTEDAPQGAALVAAGEFSIDRPDPLDRTTLANLVLQAATHYGPMPKKDPPRTYGYYDGPTTKIASATFDFPEERTLTDDPTENAGKLREVVAASIPGGVGGYSLTASGGLCAPAEPFYSMVNFASQDEPVWDSLPVFAARRGAVNVPESTYIGDIVVNSAGGAITSISEANDALGGTFATKTCQDLDCVDYTEVAVNIIAHCREYGNLNARSWPEKIAHENELTMAALAQTSEMFILERIKALSVNVTSGAETLGALIYLVDAITKAAYGIRGRFRMPRSARFVALLPAVVLDILLLDAIQNQFDRYQSRADIDAYLRSTGIDPVYYLDGQFAAGTDQTPDAAQTAAALDAFPDTIQWAMYPQGAFLGIDMGVLELGIVRDSTLNSTNDFQVFGERFRNVVRIAPAQAAYWHTTDICANGMFPPLGTARTCD
jgi:hypothetical protein